MMSSFGTPPPPRHPFVILWHPGLRKNDELLGQKSEGRSEYDELLSHKAKILISQGLSENEHWQKNRLV